MNQTSIDKSTALMSAISDGGDVRNDYQHILAMKSPMRLSKRRVRWTR